MPSENRTDLDRWKMGRVVGAENSDISVQPHPDFIPISTGGTFGIGGAAISYAALSRSEAPEFDMEDEFPPEPSETLESDFQSFHGYRLRHPNRQVQRSFGRSKADARNR